MPIPLDVCNTHCPCLGSSCTIGADPSSRTSEAWKAWKDRETGNLVSCTWLQSAWGQKKRTGNKPRKNTGKGNDSLEEGRLVSKGMWK